jgi:hypothetical protein
MDLVYFSDLKKLDELIVLGFKNVKLFFTSIYT